MGNRIENQLDRIQKYYKEEDFHLSEKELEMVQRLEQIFAIYCNTRVRRETVTKYIAAMKAADKEISEATAYRDLATAEKVFAPLQQYSKEFLKMSMTDSALEDLQMLGEQLIKAKEAGNVSDIALLVLRRDRLRRTINEMNGLNSETWNLPDFSKLEMHNYEIKLPTHLISVLKKQMLAGPVDMTDLDIDDIDFEELENDSREFEEGEEQ